MKAVEKTYYDKWNQIRTTLYHSQPSYLFSDQIGGILDQPMKSKDDQKIPKPFKSVTNCQNIILLKKKINLKFLTRENLNCQNI